VEHCLGFRIVFPDDVSHDHKIGRRCRFSGDSPDEWMPFEARKVLMGG